MLPAYRADGSLNVMVESPKGSAVKFKYDASLDLIVLSRPLPSGLVYPHDWGFVPSTSASDRDPLDALIVWEASSYPGVIIPCRSIGVLEIEQANARSRERERNDRIVMLPVNAPRCADLHTVFDLTDRWRAELELFFVSAVAFEAKDLRVLGWSGPADANQLIQRSLVPAGHQEDTHVSHAGTGGPPRL